ncbi:MAG: phospholipid carrier-dependent glycosyltransferase [Bacteroidales bacterium]|nr:phospholipid carrier-dependent glycosyltransferase [Bacteroidales bacterium]
MSFSRKYKPLMWLILISTFIRILLAQFVELGNDEVYYFTYALFPDLSHFDHPPMVGWVIQLFSFNQFLHSQLLLRIAAIVFAAINTWLIFELGSKVKNERTGWYAALLYTASIYTSLIAGVFIMPDTPQLFFWILSLYLIVEILPDKDLAPSNKRRFLLLGVLIGLAMLSKYTSVFLWFGIFLYLIIYNRAWFKNIYLYAAGIISLLIFSPVLIWNYQHHFISFTFHEDRVNIAESGIRFDFIGTEILGEFLYQNPVVFVLVWIAVIYGIRHHHRFVEWQKFQLLLFQSLPMIAVFLFFSLFRKTLPHWTGPAYISLIIIAAAFLTRKAETVQPFIPKIIRASLITIIVIVLLGIAQINFGLINLKNVIGNDLTLDMYGWRSLNKAFAPVKSKNEA